MVGAAATALDEVVVRTTVVEVTLRGPDTVTLAASVDFSFLVARAFQPGLSILYFSNLVGLGRTEIKVKEC